MISLYNKYAYDLSFCAFHKMLTALLNQYLDAGVPIEKKYLLVSKYLELAVVDYATPQSEEDRICYPLADLIVDGAICKEKVDEIAYQQIIVPFQLPETKLEVLERCMKRDYLLGLFPEVFVPFFNWKFGKLRLEDISLEQVYAMKDRVDQMIDELEHKHPKAYAIHDQFVVDDPWQATRGFKEDKYMMAYLQYIDDSLTDLQMML